MRAVHSRAVRLETIIVVISSRLHCRPHRACRRYVHAPLNARLINLRRRRPRTLVMHAGATFTHRETPERVFSEKISSHASPRHHFVTQDVRHGPSSRHTGELMTGKVLRKRRFSQNFVQNSCAKRSDARVVRVQAPFARETAATFEASKTLAIW